MYALIIISTFLCSDNTMIDKEEHFKQNEYPKAVERLNKLLSEKRKAEEFFNGQQCILEDVRAGHRKINAKN